MTDRPNLVLVTVDSLRADHCSFAGYDRETTPALDEMAADGLVFENAIAPGPSTPESMPAVFTGRDVVDDEGGTDVSGMRSRIGRHLDARDTFAEKLSRRGYATAGFTPNPFTSRFFGFDQGFDRFEDFMGTSVRQRYGRTFQQFFEGSELASLLRIGFNFWHREEVFKPWEDYEDDVAAWVETTDDPYFLWVHLMDPHVPYLPPAPYRTQSRRETYHANYRFWRGDKESPFEPTVHDRLVTAYDDTIRYTDAFLAWVTRTVDDAVVVVHGDHGEAFGEHGTYGHEAYLYEENVHVPFVVYGDGVTDESVTAPVSLRRVPSLLVQASERALTAEPGTGNTTSENAHVGSTLSLDGAPFVVSRTRSGEKVILRGQRLKYVADGTGAEVYDLARDEQTQVSDEDVRAACERLHRRISAADGERRAIRAGVEAVDERTVQPDRPPVQGVEDP